MNLTNKIDRREAIRLAGIHIHGPTDNRASKSPVDVMEWIKEPTGR
jgi:hypothetical protein